jgi:hypothetical protein
MRTPKFVIEEEDAMSEITELVHAVQALSSDELEKLLSQRKAEDKALTTLWRAALAREREERRQARELATD